MNNNSWHETNIKSMKVHKQLESESEHKRDGNAGTSRLWTFNISPQSNESEVRLVYVVAG